MKWIIGFCLLLGVSITIFSLLVIENHELKQNPKLYVIRVNHSEGVNFYGYCDNCEQWGVFHLSIAEMIVASKRLDIEELKRGDEK